MNLPPPPKKKKKKKKKNIMWHKPSIWLKCFLHSRRKDDGITPQYLCCSVHPLLSFVWPIVTIRLYPTWNRTSGCLIGEKSMYWTPTPLSGSIWLSHVKLSKIGFYFPGITHQSIFILMSLDSIFHFSLSRNTDIWWLLFADSLGWNDLHC